MTTPNWKNVQGWCHQGEGDAFGLCAWAMFGNNLALRTGQVMNDGEIENAAREMEKFNPYDSSTDHGILMQQFIDYVMTNGWPGDPLLKPKRVDQCEVSDVVAVKKEYGCGFAGLALPEDQDFTDDALDKPGVSGHAVFVVDATPDSVTFITWAYPKTVSMAWWNQFARQLYGPVWEEA